MRAMNGNVPEIQPTTPEPLGINSQLPVTQPHTPPLQDRVLVVCPHCRTTLRLRRVYMGGAVRCGRCNQTFIVPAVSDGQPIAVYDGILAPPPSELQDAAADSRSDRNRTGKTGLLDQLAEFIAKYDELQLDRDQMRAEHERARTDLDEISEQFQSVTNELNAIRAELGTIAPADVQSLASERESLSAEVERLREENHAMFAEQAKDQALITQLQQRVTEVIPIRQERDALAAKVKREEAALSAVRAEFDALTTDLSDERAALVTAAAELRRLAERLEQSGKDASHAGHDSKLAKQQLDLCKNERTSPQADQARLNIDQHNTLETLEKLTKTAADRDDARATQRDHFNAELEGSRKALDSAERAHRDELAMLRTEFVSLCAQHDRLREENRSVESLCTRLDTRDPQRTAAQAQLVAEYSARLESEQSQREELTAGVHLLHAATEATDRAIEEYPSTVLNSPIMRLPRQTSWRPLETRPKR